MFEPKGWFVDVTRLAVDRWAVAAGDDGFWLMDGWMLFLGGVVYYS